MLRLLLLFGMLGCAAAMNAQPYRPAPAQLNDYNFSHGLDAKDIALNVFPNPMTHVLTIWARDLHPDTAHYLRVLGISGETVLQTILTNRETNLDLTHLPEGWYVVHLRKGRTQHTQRVFKMTGP
jgi:predicted lipid carrier protein YhbT